MSAIELSATSGCRRILETIDGVMEDREYLVDTADPEAAVGDINVPKLGDAHPSRVGLYVISRELTRQAPDKVLVRLQYSDRGRDAGEEYQTELEMEIGAKEVTIYVDLDGKKIGDEEKGEHGASVYVPEEIDTITTWQSFVNRGAIRRLRGTVNEKDFMGESTGTFLYLGAMVRRVGKEKHQLLHRFMFDEYGHYHERVMMEEVCTGEGAARTCDWVVKTDEQGVLHERFRVYNEADFGLLGLSL